MIIILLFYPDDADNMEAQLCNELVWKYYIATKELVDDLDTL